jgi:hypothetical protein
MVHVRGLSEVERQTLKKEARRARGSRQRARPLILLSNRGHAEPEIARIFECDEATVREDPPLRGSGSDGASRSPWRRAAAARRRDRPGEVPAHGWQRPPGSGLQWRDLERAPAAHPPGDGRGPPALVCDGATPPSCARTFAGGVPSSSIHTDKAVQVWLEAHPRVELLFLPSYAGHRENPVENGW